MYPNIIIKTNVTAAQLLLT
jgi:hypothetical protein